MTLKELKQALSKLSLDFDDTEIILQFVKNGELDYELLAGVGFLPDYSSCVLVSNDAIKKVAKEKTAKFIDGRDLPTNLDEL